MKRSSFCKLLLSEWTLGRKLFQKHWLLRALCFSLLNGWKLHELGGLLTLGLAPPCLLHLSCRQQVIQCSIPLPTHAPWAALSTHLSATEHRKKGSGFLSFLPQRCLSFLYESWLINKGAGLTCISSCFYLWERRHFLADTFCSLSSSAFQRACFDGLNRLPFLVRKGQWLVIKGQTPYVNPRGKKSARVSASSQTDLCWSWRALPGVRGQKQEGKSMCDVAASLWLPTKKLTLVEHLLCVVSALPKKILNKFQYYFILQIAEETKFWLR